MTAFFMKAKFMCIIKLKYFERFPIAFWCQFKHKKTAQCSERFAETYYDAKKKKNEFIFPWFPENKQNVPSLATQKKAEISWKKHFDNYITLVPIISSELTSSSDFFLVFVVPFFHWLWRGKNNVPDVRGMRPSVVTYLNTSVGSPIMLSYWVKK